MEDTLRVMAITFSYVEGSESLDGFLNKRGKHDAVRAPGLFAASAISTSRKQRYQDAATTYRAYVARDPNSDYAPNLAMQGIEAYQQGRVHAARAGWASTSTSSATTSERAFWQGRDRAKYPQVVEGAEGRTSRTSPPISTPRRRSRRKTEDYTEAAKWYRDYLKSFPDDPDSAGTNYLLAETLFESKQFADAATEYERTAYFYPKNEKSATAGYASLVAVQAAGRAPQRHREDGVAREGDRCGREVRAGVPGTSGQRGRAHARCRRDLRCEGFAARHPGVGDAALRRQPPVDSAKQRIGWTIVAQSNFDLGNFDKAEPGPSWRARARGHG